MVGQNNQSRFRNVKRKIWHKKHSLSEVYKKIQHLEENDKVLVARGECSRSKDIASLRVVGSQDMSIIGLQRKTLEIQTINRTKNGIDVKDDPNFLTQIGISCKNVMRSLDLCKNCKKQVKNMSQYDDERMTITYIPRGGDNAIKPEDNMFDYDPFNPIKYGMEQWGPKFRWDHLDNLRLQIWDRNYSIRPSGVDKCGLGVFAEQRIVVNYDKEGMPILVDLFPYVGQEHPTNNRIGGFSKWLEIFPSFSRYFVSFRDMSSNITNRTFIGGFPIRNSNIAGFINTAIHRPDFKRNVDFEASREQHPRFKAGFKPRYIMTVAIRTIEVGEELLTHYHLMGAIQNVPLILLYK